MNGESLVFQIVVIAAVALVFGVTIAAAVRFTSAAAHRLRRRHEARR